MHCPTLTFEVADTDKDALLFVGHRRYQTIENSLFNVRCNPFWACSAWIALSRYGMLGACTACQEQMVTQLQPRKPLRPDMLSRCRRTRTGPHLVCDGVPQDVAHALPQQLPVEAVAHEDAAVHGDAGARRGPPRPAGGRSPLPLLRGDPVAVQVHQDAAQRRRYEPRAAAGD